MAGKSRTAAAYTIRVIGDTWTLRLLRSLFRGTHTFTGFTATLGISKAVLTDRLDRLVRHGVLSRSVSPGRHPSYLLTESGLDLWSVLFAMWHWETQWGAPDDTRGILADAPRRTATHAVCGHVLEPQLRCVRCHQAVRDRDLHAVARGDDDLAGEPPAAEPGFRRSRNNDLSEFRTLQLVLGDQVGAYIVASALRGARTFSEIQKAVDVDAPLLTNRLSTLQERGILVAQPYAGTRNHYLLTDSGRALLPIMVEMVRWGERWSPTSAGEYLQHLPCGEPLQARWFCRHCNTRLERGEIQITEGFGA